MSDELHVNPNVGLSTRQVKRQVSRHQVNYQPKSLTRSVGSIVRGNTLTLFNLINLALGALVFYTGSYKNLLFLVIAIANTVIGTFQEVRSKRRIDRMALLSQNRVIVCRNARLGRIFPDQIVRGDVVILRLGDQVPVDGRIVQTRALAVNESQITGEPKSVDKRVGDSVTSGSVVVSGNAQMVAIRVGAKAFVNRLSNRARTNHRESSKLLNVIRDIIRVLTFVIVPLGIALFVSKMMQNDDLDHAILGTVAATIGMIPEGLVLLSSVTLAVSAMKLARHRVLVRSLPSIETLARANTLCLDKTGTITTGQLRVTNLIPLGRVRKSRLAKLIGTTVHAIDDTDATAVALKQCFMGTDQPAQKIVPFSSARKWSGAEFKSGTFVIGVPQWISRLSPELTRRVNHYAQRGYRVLGLAETSALKRSASQSHLLALILITDVIRPHAKQIFKYFTKQGVQLDVISGDDPVTVASVAKQAGIPEANRAVDMSTVQPHVDYRSLVKRNRVFGRVQPDQKRKLVRAMQANGHTVGMTGDGVNDLLALKQADCGIAMASGSESTKSIANFVLLDSNFASLVNVLGEGRRVTNNVADVASLYLIRTMYSLILTFLFIFAARDYPFQPIQLTPITTFMIGIPTFFLALEPNYERISHQFTEKIVDVAIPAALLIIGYVLLVESLGSYFAVPYPETSSINALLTGIICWLALVKVSKPLSNFKLLVITAAGLFFGMTFLAWSHVFNLLAIYQFQLPWLVVGIGLTTYPAFLLIQVVIESLYRLTWRKLKNKGTRNLK